MVYPNTFVARSWMNHCVRICIGGIGFFYRNRLTKGWSLNDPIPTKREWNFLELYEILSVKIMMLNSFFSLSSLLGPGLPPSLKEPISESMDAEQSTFQCHFRCQNAGFFGLRPKFGEFVDQRVVGRHWLRGYVWPIIWPLKSSGPNYDNSSSNSTTCRGILGWNPLAIINVATSCPEESSEKQTDRKSVV